MATFLIAGSFRITGAQPDRDSIRFRFGVGGQAFTSSMCGISRPSLARQHAGRGDRLRTRCAG
jgi:hypothetical protein